MRIFPFTTEGRRKSLCPFTLFSCILAVFLFSCRSDGDSVSPSASEKETEETIETEETVDSSTERCIEVQGHRGARGLRAENTLAAFRYALEVRSDVLELDLHATRDDILVVTHDPAINWSICLPPEGRPAEGKVIIRSLTLEELQRYDCGSLVDPRFPDQKPEPGERIPSLREVLELVSAPKYRKVGLNIELKSIPSRPDLYPEPREYASLLMDELKKYDAVRRTTVQSFDHRVLREVLEIDPSVSVSVLTGRSSHDYAALLKKTGGRIISPHHEWITAEDVTAVRSAGGRVIPWTANNPEEWDRLIRAGVDGIITDYPCRLIAYLEKAGRRVSCPVYYPEP